MSVWVGEFAGEAVGDDASSRGLIAWDGDYLAALIEASSSSRVKHSMAAAERVGYAN
jgi:hypothetical protein